MSQREDNASNAPEQQPRIIFWINAPEAMHMLAAIEARSKKGDVCVVVSPLVEQHVEALGLPFVEDLAKVLSVIRQQMHHQDFVTQYKEWLAKRSKESEVNLQRIGAVVGPLGKLAEILKPALEHPAAREPMAEAIGKAFASLARRDVVNRDIDDACTVLREGARENLDVAVRKAFLALTNTDEVGARHGDVAAAWRVVAFALHALLRGNSDERKTLRYVHRQIASGDIPKASAVLFAEAAIEAFHVRDDETMQLGAIAALKVALSTQDDRFGSLDDAKIKIALSNATPADRGVRRGRKGGAARHGPARVAAELALEVGAFGSAPRTDESRLAAIARLTREFDEARRRAKKRLDRDAE